MNVPFLCLALLRTIILAGGRIDALLRRKPLWFANVLAAILITLFSLSLSPSLSLSLWKKIIQIIWRIVNFRIFWCAALREQARRRHPRRLSKMKKWQLRASLSGILM